MKTGARPQPCLCQGQTTDATPIAVIGMACRYPGADNVRQLWENVLARRRQFRRFPKGRLPLEDYFDPDPKTADTTYCPRAAVIDGFVFDWARRRIPQSTYAATDIVHWLALETALDALEDAGYDAGQVPGRRCGAIVGNSLTGEQTRAHTMRLRWPFVRRALQAAGRSRQVDPRQIQELQKALEDFYKSAFPAVNEDTLAGALSNTIAGRICNYLDLSGGGYTVDGACASSLLAVATAARQLSDGSLDLALAGGVDVSLDPFELVGFAKAGALSGTDMNVYDAAGNGFIPGEGCGFVVLKRLADARRDGDYVYAVLHGWGVSSDGGRSAITAPSVEGQYLAICRAYRRAPYGPGKLDFIEGHGTGTAVGDQVEMEALARAVESEEGNDPVRCRRCGVTSLKSLVGHTKAASGIGGFIKAVLAVNRRLIPPTAGCRTPHPVFSDKARALFPVLRGEPRPRESRLRAGISAMGFGGINCHVTVESADAPRRGSAGGLSEHVLLASHQETELLVLRAETPPQMEREAERLAQMADDMSPAELVDLAAHLAARTHPKPSLHAAVIAASPEQLAQRLRRLAGILREDLPAAGSVLSDTGEDIWLGHRPRIPRVGMLFPGQGSQQLNMARRLTERFAWGRQLADRADAAAAAVGSGPVQPLIYRSTEAGGDRIGEWSRQLGRTEHAQPAICLASMLWFRFLQRIGIRPKAVGGHSLGEAVAFWAAGVMDDGALLHFVARRGRIMAQSATTPAGMLSLACTPQTAESLVSSLKDGYAAVANLNAPRQVVVAGERQALEQIQQMAADRGVAASRLPVSGAFHCRLAEVAAERLSVDTVLPRTGRQPRVRLFSTMDGGLIHDWRRLREHFARQMTCRVNFMTMVENMTPECDLLLEVGPGRVLTNLYGHIAGGRGPVCLPVESRSEDDRDINRVVGTLFAHGLPLDMRRFFEGRLVRPFTPPQEKIFIENPCERIPVATDDNRLSEKAANLSSELEPLVAEAAGLNADVLRDYLSARSSFLLEIIRADIQHMPGRQETLNCPAQLPEAPQSTAQASPDALDGLEALFSLVEEMTGFPKKALSAESRLLDDLNLDSIKAGDLIATFSRRMGIVGRIDPRRLANASLAEIAAALCTRGPAAPAETDPLVPDEGQILSILLRQAARRCGRHRVVLNADGRIGADLTFDETDLRHVLAAVSRRTHIDLHVDLEPLMERSLRQIAGIIARLGRQQRSSGASTPPVEHAPWVREFKLNLVEKPLAAIPRRWGRRREDRWPSARVLVLSENTDDSVARALVQQLDKLGAHVQAATFREAVRRRFNSNAAFSHFMAVFPRRTSTHEEQESLRRSVQRIAATLSPPPASAAPRRSNTLVYLQFGGGFFGNRGRCAHLHNCGAMAAAHSVQMERQDLRVRVLDFSPQLSPEAVTRRVIRESQGPTAFVAAGYDENLRRRVFQAQVLSPAAYRPRRLQWGERDVVLVTGGARGISAACALALAKVTGARMALVGSTPLSEEDKGGAASQIRETLERYEKLGLVANYYCCDVCDGSAVDALIARVTDEMGAVTGVIHGAGLNIPRPASQVSAEEALAEIAPKVMGALHLSQALARRPPRIFVGLTSIIGITGMPGNAWYAFSNEVLDLILRRFGAEHAATRTQSLAYSIWRDEGMGARMGSVNALKKMGIDAIPTEEGVKRFVRLFLKDPGVHQVMITARLGRFDLGQVPTRRQRKNKRFLEEALHVTPGVESAFLAHLNLEKDPYLVDHRFQGSYLMPTVFGLEAMAQAVSHVSGERDFSCLRIEDIRLQRPITVDPRQGADIVVWAQLEEIIQDGGPRRIRAGVYKPGAGVQTDFFAATFVIGCREQDLHQKVDLSTSPLDIHPRSDLYRQTLLFQGPRFQRIREVWKLTADEAVLSTARYSDREVSRTAFGEREKSGLLLGDAFFRDTLLQSAALLIPQETSLPVAIHRLDLFPPAAGEDPQRPAVLTIVVRRVGKSGDRNEFTVTALDGRGRVRERLEGYRLQILEHHDEYPTVEDLRNPDARDRALIRRTLETLARQLQLEFPGVDLQHVEGIHRMNRNQRHRRVRPLVVKTLLAHAGDGGGVSKNITVEWLDSGKPVIRGAGVDGLETSLAHDDRMCLVTGGKQPQGCDLAPVTPRSEQQWRALLGDERFGLARRLAESLESLDEAATRVWAAVEAFVKAGVSSPTALEVVSHDPRATLLHCRGGGIDAHVLAFPVRLTRGAERVVAVTVSKAKPTWASSDSKAVFYPGYEGLVDHRCYKITNAGPQGQTVFIQRMPVTFYPAGQLSRTVYFSHYLFWAGAVREAATWPILAQLGRQVATGKWGGVTNYTDLVILGEATTGDLLEIWLWVSGNGGPENSTLDLRFDFRKVLPNGGHQRIARLEQQSTWVRVVGPGKVQVEPYPDYYRAYIEDMLPRYDAPDRYEPLEETLSELGRSPGQEVLFSAPAGPVVRPLIDRRIIDTSLQNANVVGNIYFANYSAWQGAVRDAFFHALIPNYFQGVGEQGELLCLRCRVDHLREAMPFDRIEVTMALKRLARCRATLHFEYFQENTDGRPLKLATGSQEIVWVRRDTNRRPLPCPFPEAVVQAFERAVNEKALQINWHEG